MTTSIIIYRNPAEAMFWESGMAFPLIASLAVGFLLFVTLMHFAAKFSKDWRGPGKVPTILAGTTSIAAAIATFHYLFN